MPATLPIPARPGRPAQGRLPAASMHVRRARQGPTALGLRLAAPQQLGLSGAAASTRSRHAEHETADEAHRRNPNTCSLDHREPSLHLAPNGAGWVAGRARNWLTLGAATEGMPSGHCPPPRSTYDDGKRVLNLSRRSYEACPWRALSADGACRSAAMRLAARTCTKRPSSPGRARRPGAHRRPCVGELVGPVVEFGQHERQVGR